MQVVNLSKQVRWPKQKPNLLRVNPCKTYFHEVQSTWRLTAQVGNNSPIKFSLLAEITSGRSQFLKYLTLI